MRDGVRTRENIIRQAATLFNRQGFSGASLSDIMEATGLQKGGIYRHFESKEALALEAFDYAAKRLQDRIAEALAGRTHSIDRLRGIVGVYADLPLDPPVPGGCPVMNAAIENDDGNPALRDRARGAMDWLRALIRRTVNEGIGRGEVRAEADGDEIATVLIAAMEGGVMLSTLYGDPEHAQRTADYLSWYLEANVSAA